MHVSSRHVRIDVCTFETNFVKNKHPEGHQGSANSIYIWHVIKAPKYVEELCFSFFFPSDNIETKYIAEKRVSN